MYLDLSKKAIYLSSDLFCFGKCSFWFQKCSACSEKGLIWGENWIGVPNFPPLYVEGCRDLTTVLSGGFLSFLLKTIVRNQLYSSIKIFNNLSTIFQFTTREKFNEKFSFSEMLLSNVSRVLEKTPRKLRPSMVL